MRQAPITNEDLIQISRYIEKGFNKIIIPIYGLELISSLLDSQQMKKSTIYIDPNTRKYKFLKANNDICEGEIPEEIDLKKLESRLEDDALKKVIFEYIYKRTFIPERILLIGATGSGKTTLTCYFHEIPLERWTKDLEQRVSHELKEKDLERRYKLALKSNAQRKKNRVYVDENTRQYTVINDDAELFEGILPNDICLNNLNLKLQEPTLKKQILKFLLSTKHIKDSYQNRIEGEEIYVDFTHEYNQDTPRIGTGAYSKSKYVTAFIKNDLLIFDSAGLSDTNKNRRLANALSLEYMVKKIGTIKLAVVIEYGALEVQNGNSFRSIIELLSNLLVLDQMNEPNNILFLINSKNSFPPSIDQVKQRIKKAQGLVRENLLASPNENFLKMQENLFQFMLRDDANIIVTHPTTDANGFNRRKILNTIRTMQSVNSNFFSFNFFEKNEIRKKLINIVPLYLEIIKDEIYWRTLKKINETFHKKIQNYSDIKDEKILRQKIDHDLKYESNVLNEEKYKILEVEKSIKELEKSIALLHPDQEIEFCTLTADYSASFIYSAAGVLATSAATAKGIIVGGSAAAATVAGAATGAGVATIVIGAGLLGLGAAAVTGGVFYGGSILLDYLNTPVENQSVKLTYNGPRFKRTQVNKKIVWPSEDEEKCRYYEIDLPIVESDDKNECIVTFVMKIAEGPQTSQTLTIWGEKRNHPDLGYKIRREEANKAKLLEENRMQVSIKDQRESFIEILNNKSTFKSEKLINNNLARTEWKKCIRKIKKINKELEAIETILPHITGESDFDEYLEKYPKLKTRMNKDKYAKEKEPEMEQPSKCASRYSLFSVNRQLGTVASVEDELPASRQARYQND